jgi:UDP-N-acetylglucosamine 2-epimerase (non-hydrolysing)
MVKTTNPKFIHIVGARPNFVKAFPLIKHMNKDNDISQVLIHTGQHYDYQMSQSFFDTFEIKKPNYFLDIGHHDPIIQIGKIIEKMYKILIAEKPDLVIVYGDVNSTVGATVIAKRLNIDVVHVEAGLRSFDMDMPEEINRLIVDKLSDLLLIHSESAKENLINEGVSQNKVKFVGNIMIDSLVMMKNKINKSVLKKYDLKEKEYCLLTMHRPSNVDHISTRNLNIDFINQVSKKIKVICPVHHRMKDMITKLDNNNFIGIEPLNYIDFLSLENYAKFVITDSGGVQEETSFLNVPCFTLRENTERPVTIDIGTNQLIDNNYNDFEKKLHLALSNIKKKQSSKIPLWDGATSKRIKRELLNYIKDK